MVRIEPRKTDLLFSTVPGIQLVEDATLLQAIVLGYCLSSSQSYNVHECVPFSNLKVPGRQVSNLKDYRFVYYCLGCKRRMQRASCTFLEVLSNVN